MEQQEKMNLVDYTDIYGKICENTDLISAELFDEFGVKRGLRDKNGNGVLSGLTHISKIQAFKEVNGEKIPCDGKLWRSHLFAFIWAFTEYGRAGRI